MGRHPCWQRYGRVVWTPQLRLLRLIVRYNRKTCRILGLGVPFTLLVMTGTVTNLILLIIFTATLGSNATVACVTVDAIVGVSSSFLEGCIKVVSSLVSMAYGAENYDLVGQYAQAGCTAYMLTELPMIFFWGSAIENILALVQFGDHVITLTDSYVWVWVVGNIILGVNEANLDLLKVVDREQYVNVLNCVSSLVHVGLAALFVFTVKCNLVMLGLLMLVV